MALVGKAAARRVAVPHEEGEWMAFRPLTWREAKEARGVAENDMADYILLHSIEDWSYAEPVSQEAIDSLDVKTGLWALQEATRDSSPLQTISPSGSNGTISETGAGPTS